MEKHHENHNPLISHKRKPEPEGPGQENITNLESWAFRLSLMSVCVFLLLDIERSLDPLKKGASEYKCNYLRIYHLTRSLGSLLLILFRNPGRAATMETHPTVHINSSHSCPGHAESGLLTLREAVGSFPWLLLSSAGVQSLSQESAILIQILALLLTRCVTLGTALVLTVGLCVLGALCEGEIG